MINKLRAVKMCKTFFQSLAPFEGMARGRRRCEIADNKKRLIKITEVYIVAQLDENKKMKN